MKPESSLGVGITFLVITLALLFTFLASTDILKEEYYTPTFSIRADPYIVHEESVVNGLGIPFLDHFKNLTLERKTQGLNWAKEIPLKKEDILTMEWTVDFIDNSILKEHMKSHVKIIVDENLSEFTNRTITYLNNDNEFLITWEINYEDLK